jgi:DNA primase
MNFSEQLKSQLNIVDVVQQYVRLKRQGAGPRWVGLCPFHSEKTPSFGVHSALGYYKCFGCDAAGDVFKFVQTIENLTFPETLKVLADRYGIAMPERPRSDDPEEQRRAALYDMNEIAADLFQRNLREPAGAEARRYLESRNVSKGAMDEFRIGLADASWDQLTQLVQKFGSALMEESGLVKRREGSAGFYDVFRSRIMFPIHNELGKLIGFGARALSNDVQPKYVNTGDTLLYKKKQVLYNLHRAKTDARKNDRMILVEGYMDVIGIYSAGIHEVVSISGTAMDMEQVKAIKRQVAHQQAARGEVILNLDPDAAGVRSTEKYIATFLAEGLRVRVLVIPGGLDPDEYIQQFGVDEYRKLLQGASSYFHWLADRARSKFDMKTAEGRIDAFNFLWPSIQQVGDKLERSAIARDIADYLNVDREAVMQNFKRAPKTQSGAAVGKISSALPPNERILLSALLASINARAAVRHYMASSKHFPLLEARDIFESVLQFDEANRAFSIEAITAGLSERSQRMLAEVSFSESVLEEETAAGQALYCLQALEAKAMSVQSEGLRRQIKELEASGNIEGALRVMQELNQLKKGQPGQ